MGMDCMYLKNEKYSMMFLVHNVLLKKTCPEQICLAVCKKDKMQEL